MKRANTVRCPAGNGGGSNGWYPSIESWRLSTGKWTVIGGVPGRDIAGSALSDVKAADEEEFEIIDSVRARSTALDPGPGALLVEGAGRVATECNDEKDDLRPGILSPAVIRVGDCIVSDAMAEVGEIKLSVRKLLGDADSCACAASAFTVKGASRAGFRPP